VAVIPATWHFTWTGDKECDGMAKKERSGEGREGIESVIIRAKPAG